MKSKTRLSAMFLVVVMLFTMIAPMMPISADKGNWQVASPDGTTVMYITLTDDGKLTYTAAQDGVTVVEESVLGIVTSAGDFTQGLEYGSEETAVINETYDVISGKMSTYTNYCNELTLHFTKGGVDFALVARAYDDGIAFRYVITTAEAGAMTIDPNAEITTVNLPDDSDIWYMPRTDADFMYETNYEIGTVAGAANGLQASMPMLYETNGKYGLIMEADRHGNYVGSLLYHDGNGVMRTIFDLVQTTAVNTTTPFTSPWRTVIIGSAEEIMMNTMVENLSPAADEAYDFESWVQPGMSSWSWVSYYGGQEDPRIHKKFIDLAADMGWEYYILDEKWQPGSQTAGSRYDGMWDWFDEVRDYADEKGVKLFAWVDKQDVDTDEEREKRFKDWSEAGIVGIKVDFFYNESQEILQLHDDIYADAAKYKLMVNVHGSNPSSGEIRTYPNIITREAIKGQEQGGITANQYTLIPFIRAAVGSADVTEQLYSRDVGNTSMGFQIALSTLIQNGLHSMGDKPENYYSIPAAIDYYNDFPTTWDDLYVINAEVGKRVNLARNSDGTWYAAGISVDASTFTYKPEFLEAGVKYTAILYKEVDGERQNLTMETMNDVTADTELSINVQNGGGYAIKFVPVEDELVSIKTSLSSITVERLGTTDVELSFAPSGTILTGVKWEVADPAIAQVLPTGKGATIKGLTNGKTTVTVTSAHDATKQAVINVSVVSGEYILNENDWKVINDNKNYQITGENQVIINAETGVIDKNVFAMPVPEGDVNFTITARISGGLNANYQGGFIGVFTENLGTFASFGRRYHDMFGQNGNNNLLCAMSNTKESYLADTNVNADVYVMLSKEDNQFVSYYKYNEADDWKPTGAEYILDNADLANSEQLYVGFYAGCGGTNTGTAITISDFTYSSTTSGVAETTPAVMNPAAVGKDDTVFEAEDAKLSGGANKVINAEASNDMHVGNIGGADAGAVTFNVPAAVAGEATVKVYFITAEARSFSVTVNGEALADLACVGTSWTAVEATPGEFTANLVAGNNTITLGGVDGAYAPNLDRIEVIYPEYTFKSAEDTYEMENGTLSGGAQKWGVADSYNNTATNGFVGSVGGAGKGAVTFTLENNVAGKAKLKIRYATAADRDLSVTVNGTTYVVNCPAAGEWTQFTDTSFVEVEVELAKGINTITFGGNNGADAPNLDYFTLEMDELAALAFYSASLTLQTNLQINYRVDKTYFTEYGYTNPYAIFEMNGVQTVVTEYDEDDEYYIFRFKNIAPKKINDYVDAWVFADYYGEEHSSPMRRYSVATYCYNQLRDTETPPSDTFRTMLVDLLNYGTAAQKYLDYNTENLANAGLTEEEASWATETIEKPASVTSTKYNVIANATATWRSAKLLLGDTVKLSFRVITEDIDGVTVKIAVGTPENVQFSIPGELLEPASEKNSYDILLDRLNARQMRDSLFVTVYKDGVAISNTLRYSIASYANAKWTSANGELVTLMKAMMKYGDSAKLYFTAQ